jgi:hypothetical protein
MNVDQDHELNFIASLLQPLLRIALEVRVL